MCFSQKPGLRVQPRGAQAILIETEVSVISDAFDKAIDGKYGRVEAVLGHFDLVFDR